MIRPCRIRVLQACCLALLVAPWLTHGTSAAGEVIAPSPVASGAPAAGLPPQGMYESCAYDTAAALAICNRHLDQMAAAGFKLVVNYDGLYAPMAQLRAYADHANALGMQVIVPMNDEVWWTGNARAAFPDLAATCACSANASFARYIVSELKDHPGTWGYYLGDEVSSNFGAAHRYWSVVHVADPAKPTLIVSAEDEGTLGTGMDSVADANGITTLAPDIYPVGREPQASQDPLRSVGQSLAHVQGLAARYGKNSGVVLQAYNWKKMYPEETWLAVARFPTRAEMRFMRDDALRNGRPKLILWYSYFDLKHDRPWARHWADLRWAAFGTRAGC